MGISAAGWLSWGSGMGGGGGGGTRTAVAARSSVAGAEAGLGGAGGTCPTGRAAGSVVIGWLLVFTGIALLVHAFRARRWEGALWSGLVGAAWLLGSGIAALAARRRQAC